MQRYKQVILGVSLVLAVSVVSLPVRAAQLTNDQVKAILGMLQVFGADQSVIGTVQAALTGSATSSQPTLGEQGNLSLGQLGKLLCVALDRNLSVGSRGDDVRKLQDLLREDPESGFTASSTGLFGPQTAKAMARFQIKNGIASSTQGEVGPRTRAFFERACGKGLENSKKEDHERDGEDRKTEHATSTRATTEQRMYFGTIQSIASSSLVLQLKNGSTTAPITIVPTTAIKLSAASSTLQGTVADLTVGTQVGVEVSKNPDGSLTARMIAVGMLMPQVKTETQSKNPMMPPQGFLKKNDR